MEQTPMPDLGIKSFAACIPRLRMDRASIAAAHAWAMPSLRGMGKGERSFCSWDEDSITMSVDAVRACLRGAAPGRIGSLTFASTTSPFSDLQNASLVAAASGLPENVSTMDASGSLRAGTSALIRALESITQSDAVVVAADARHARPASPQEMQYGAGSLALTVGRGDLIARHLGSVSTANQFIDHFRAEGQKYDYQWEERWIRDEGYLKIVPDVVKRLLEETGTQVSGIEFFCLAATLSGISAAVAKRLGFKPESVVDNLAARCGDTGAAHPLMLLATALESAKAGQRILLVGFGTGCDALLFEATESIGSYRSASPVSSALARGVNDKSYNKFLSFSDELDLDWGMRAETDAKTALTQLYRARDQVVSFTGGRCAKCDTIQFPRMPSCVRCGSTAPMAAAPLADEPAKVATFTADWLMFYPSPPLYVGLVQFDNGARVLMEMVDVDPAKFDVGTPLRMVFRIKEKDSLRHYSRYFWKAVPLG
jgi:3-hydroxy-3-methylglutaryl CoA synthase